MSSPSRSHSTFHRVQPTEVKIAIPNPSCPFRRSLTTSRLNLRGPANDPWAKREAWRHSPEFSKIRQVSRMFPGFGLAVVAFGAYLAYEKLAGDANEHGHH